MVVDGETLKLIVPPEMVTVPEVEVLSKVNVPAVLAVPGTIVPWA
jgi:hypothetical protein